MKVYKTNNVFDHVEIMLQEYLGNRPEYDNTVFVLGYNILQDLRDVYQRFPNHRVIIYQLEQMHDTSHWASEHTLKLLKQAHEIWDYDYSNIQWMRKNFRLDAKFFPMLSTQSLITTDIESETELDIDVLFYGYLHERRAKLLFNLQQKAAGKFKIFNMYGIWGEELNEYISRSKIILNIHSSEIAKQEQVRMFYPVINGRCVLSERSEYNYLGNSIVEVPYEKVSDAVISLLKTGKWKDYASNSYMNYSDVSERYLSKIQF